MCAEGAHTSTSPFPSSFRTQWYSNNFCATQVWLIDEQFLLAVLPFHSRSFRGQVSTATAVSKDAGQDWEIASFLSSRNWKKSEHLKQIKAKVEFWKKRKFLKNNPKDLQWKMLVSLTIYINQQLDIYLSLSPVEKAKRYGNNLETIKSINLIPRFLFLIQCKRFIIAPLPNPYSTTNTKLI